MGIRGGYRGDLGCEFRIRGGRFLPNMRFLWTCPEPDYWVREVGKIVTGLVWCGGNFGGKWNV